MKSIYNNNNNKATTTTSSYTNYESKYHDTEVPTTLLYSDSIDSFVINNQHDAIELSNTTLTAVTDSTAFAASLVDTHTTPSTTMYNHITSEYIIHELLVNKQAIKQLKVNLNKEKDNIKEAFHSYDNYFTSHKERILKKMMMMMSGDEDAGGGTGSSSSSLVLKINDDRDDDEEDSFAMFSSPLNKSSLSRNNNNSLSNNKKKDKVKIEFEDSDKMKRRNTLRQYTQNKCYTESTQTDSNDYNSIQTIAPPIPVKTLLQKVNLLASMPTKHGEGGGGEEEELITSIPDISLIKLSQPFIGFIRQHEKLLARENGLMRVALREFQRLYDLIKLHIDDILIHQPTYHIQRQALFYLQNIIIDHQWLFQPKYFIKKVCANPLEDPIDVAAQSKVIYNFQEIKNNIQSQINNLSSSTTTTTTANTTTTSTTNKNNSNNTVAISHTAPTITNIASSNNSNNYSNKNNNNNNVNYTDSSDTHDDNNYINNNDNNQISKEEKLKNLNAIKKEINNVIIDLNHRRNHHGNWRALLYRTDGSIDINMSIDSYEPHIKIEILLEKLNYLHIKSHEREKQYIDLTTKLHEEIKELKLRNINTNRSPSRSNRRLTLIDEENYSNDYGENNILEGKSMNKNNDHDNRSLKKNSQIIDVNIKNKLTMSYSSNSSSYYNRGGSGGGGDSYDDVEDCDIYNHDDMMKQYEDIYDETISLNSNNKDNNNQDGFQFIYDHNSHYNNNNNNNTMNSSPSPPRDNSSPYLSSSFSTIHGISNNNFKDNPSTMVSGQKNSIQTNSTAKINNKNEINDDNNSNKIRRWNSSPPHNRTNKTTHSTATTTTSTAISTSKNGFYNIITPSAAATVAATTTNEAVISTVSTVAKDKPKKNVRVSSANSNKASTTTTTTNLTSGGKKNSVILTKGMTKKKKVTISKSDDQNDYNSLPRSYSISAKSNDIDIVTTAATSISEEQEKATAAAVVDDDDDEIYEAMNVNNVPINHDIEKSTCDHDIESALLEFSTENEDKKCIESSFVTVKEEFLLESSILQQQQNSNLTRESVQQKINNNSNINYRKSISELDNKNDISRLAISSKQHPYYHNDDHHQHRNNDNNSNDNNDMTNDKIAEYENSLHNVFNTLNILYSSLYDKKQKIRTRKQPDDKKYGANTDTTVMDKNDDNNQHDNIQQKHYRDDDNVKNHKHNIKNESKKQHHSNIIDSLPTSNHMKLQQNLLDNSIQFIKNLDNHHQQQQHQYSSGREYIKFPKTQLNPPEIPKRISKNPDIPRDFKHLLVRPVTAPLAVVEKNKNSFSSVINRSLNNYNNNNNSSSCSSNAVVGDSTMGVPSIIIPLNTTTTIINAAQTTIAPSSTINNNTSKVVAIGNKSPKNSYRDVVTQRRRDNGKEIMKLSSSSYHKNDNDMNNDHNFIDDNDFDYYYNHNDSIKARNNIETTTPRTATVAPAPGISSPSSPLVSSASSSPSSQFLPTNKSSSFLTLPDVKLPIIETRLPTTIIKTENEHAANIDNNNKLKHNFDIKNIIDHNFNDDRDSDDDSAKFLQLNRNISSVQLSNPILRDISIICQKLIDEFVFISSNHKNRNDRKKNNHDDNYHDVNDNDNLDDNDDVLSNDDSLNNNLNDDNDSTSKNSYFHNYHDDDDHHHQQQQQQYDININPIYNPKLYHNFNKQYPNTSDISNYLSIVKDKLQHHRHEAKKIEQILQNKFINSTTTDRINSTTANNNSLKGIANSHYSNIINRPQSATAAMSIVKPPQQVRSLLSSSTTTTAINQGREKAVDVDKIRRRGRGGDGQNIENNNNSNNDHHHHHHQRPATAIPHIYQDSYQHEQSFYNNQHYHHQQQQQQQQQQQDTSNNYGYHHSHIDDDNDNDNKNYHHNHSTSRKVLRPTTAAVIRQDYSKGNGHTTNTRFSQSYNEDNNYNNDYVVIVDDDR